MGESYLTNISISRTGKIAGINDNVLEVILLDESSQKEREWFHPNFFHSECSIGLNDSFVLEEGLYEGKEATLYEKVAKCGVVKDISENKIKLNIASDLPANLRENVQTELDADLFDCPVKKGDEIVYCWARIIAIEGPVVEKERYVKLTNRERHFKIKEE